MYRDLRRGGWSRWYSFLTASGLWAYWPFGLLFPSADDPIERALHGATIVERDEQGLVLKTEDGRLYGLAFNRRDDAEILGVHAFDEEI